MILELIKKTRSHRHFYNEEVKEKTILEILNAARYASSAKNKQILRYAYTVDNEKCKEIFKNMGLGGALKVEEKPTIDERPRGIISIATDDTLTQDISILFFNMGLASQNILLAVNELGLNACIVMAFNKKEIDRIFNLPKNYSTKALIILGKGKEEIEILNAHSNDDTKYFRENGKHFVPKIVLEDLIIK